MTNYKKGARLEYQVIDDYEEKGFSSTRTAGSHGVFDVISWNKDIVIFTQAKAQKDKPKSVAASLKKYEKDINQICLQSVPPYGIKELQIKTDRKGTEKMLILP